MDGLQELEGLLPFLRQVQQEDHAGVVLAQHLGPAVHELLMQVVHVLLGVPFQGKVALLFLVIGEQEQVHEGDGIAVDAPCDAPIVVVLGGVGREEQAGHLIVQVRHFGKLPGGDGVGEGIAVHGLGVGQAQGGVDLVISLQLLQQGLFLVIVPFGHQQRRHVLGAEAVVDGLLGDLALALAAGPQLGLAVDIGALVGHPEPQHQQHGKDRHAHIPGLHHQPAPGLDGGDEAPVLGLLHGPGKQDQQPRHEGKDRQQAEADGLDEHQAHVEADLKLHEHHGRQARDGGQAAGGNGGDGRRQGGDAGAAVVVGVLPGLQEAVQQDDGIVDGQGQLEDHRHRVGDKGDLPQQEVGPHVQQGRRAEGEHQHRDLGVGMGRKAQHQDDDHHGHRQDDPHLLFQVRRLGRPHGGVHIGVVGLQQGSDLLHGLLAHRVVLFPVKGHGDEGVGPLEIFLDVLRGLFLPVLLAAKGGAGHARDPFKLFGQISGRVIGRVGHHHPG